MQGWVRLPRPVHRIQKEVQVQEHNHVAPSTATRLAVVQECQSYDSQVIVLHNGTTTHWYASKMQFFSSRLTEIQQTPPSCARPTFQVSYPADALPVFATCRKSFGPQFTSSQKSLQPHRNF